MPKKKRFHLDERYITVNLTLTIVIYSVVVPFCIYLCVDNFIRKDYLVAYYALFCAVFTAIATICFAICKFGRKKRLWLMHLAINIQCFVYWITFTFFLYTGGTEGTSIFLIFVAVPVVYYFFNLFYGAYFTTVFFIIMTVYMHSPIHENGYRFPDSYYSRMPMMYLAIVIMCAIAQYEIIKARIQQDDALEEAKHASEAKTDFLANTSHEIRTPINAVLGMNEMILRETEKAERLPDSDSAGFREAFKKIKNYSGNVDSAGSNLLAIINDILDFTKIEEGKMDIIEVEYQLSSVLNDVSNMIYFKAKDKGLSFETDIDKNLPDNLYGDVVRVRQVMTNLLSNAVKYTDEGSVLLKMYGMESDRLVDGKEIINLVIEVTDTGIGISEENLGKLFGKFERVDLEKNSTKEGTGLGLAITKMLLDMMGGEIVVRSEYGKGSTFIATLPQIVLSKDPVGNFKEKFEKSLGKRADYHESFRAPSAKVLIVDDTRMNLIVATEFLRDTRIKIDTAGGGKEAIELALQNKYDVILMDQRMPEMDGAEALKNIKAHKEGPNIDTPVICLTADAVVGARERYLSKGFNDYLTKPIDSTSLEAMLKKYLPMSKVTIVKANDEAKADVKTEVKDDLSVLKEAGIDTDKGIANCGGEKSFYIEMLAEYVADSSEKKEKLSQHLTGGNLKEYGVIVHSIKSTSATIGVMTVSAKALLLENAAKEGDKDYITLEHDAMIEEYDKFVTLIKGVVPESAIKTSDDEVMEFAPEK